MAGEKMNKKGLTTLEFCILTAVVVAAWLGIRGYFERALQGNWRSNIDNFSDELYDRDTSSETGTVSSDPSAIRIRNANMNAKYLDGSGNAGVSLGSGMHDVSGWGDTM
jgi:hypothetical protein